jgi:hypothetical protein
MRLYSELEGSKWRQRALSPPLKQFLGLGKLSGSLSVRLALLMDSM